MNRQSSIQEAFGWLRSDNIWYQAKSSIPYLLFVFHGHQLAGTPELINLLH